MKKTKQTTVRMHMNPEEALGSVAHVIDKDYRAKESHVSEDGEFEIWCDKGVYEVYKENFEDSIKDIIRSRSARIGRFWIKMVTKSLHTSRV